MMVWLAMLGAALGVRDGIHVAVLFGVRMLPERTRALVYRLAWLVVAVFAGFLVWDGSILVRQTMVERFATLDLAVGWLYLAVPVSGVLMLVYAAANAMRAEAPSEYRGEAAMSVRARLIALLVAAAALAGALATLGVYGGVAAPVGVLIGAFALMLALSMPVAFALAVASLMSALWIGLPGLVVAQRMAAGINSPALLAIPFFIFAGQIMAEGGIALRLVDFARVLVGPIPGGLAMVNIVTAMLFGGISGSAAADVSATGSVLIPTMTKQGYDRDYSVAVTVAGSTQGIIIPPSHNAIIYSLAAGGVSISGLFLAGYLPGLLIGIALMLVAGLVALRRGYARAERPPARECLRILVSVLPGLLVGLVIVGGIVFGVFTATESGAIGVWLALLVSALVYRELTWAKLWHIAVQSVRVIAMVMLLIATAFAFGWLMAYLNIPHDLAVGLTHISTSPAIELLLINGLVLVLGAVMDMAPLILILTPVLLPIVTAAPINMDPVQFGIVLLLGLAIGLTTPPVGTALFVGSGVGGVPLERVSKSMLYFWPPLLVVLALVTYFPNIVEVLPRLFGV
jgi:tripartite ATP-independent transporter DctM subunit